MRYGVVLGPLSWVEQVQAEFNQSLRALGCNDEISLLEIIFCFYIHFTKTVPGTGVIVISWKIPAVPPKVPPI